MGEGFNISKKQLSSQRLKSIDTLRGLVILLMALDHVRHFWLPNGADPTLLDQTTLGLFMTRWVTHLCAPLFVFLAGCSAYLSLHQGKPKGQVSRDLFVRGWILIALELGFMSSLWMGSSDVLLLQVLWALGSSMIALSLLIWLPEWVIGLFGISQVLGHNLLDSVHLPSNHFFSTPWAILHGAHSTVTIGGAQVYILYPLMPWLGVMALGFVFGNIMVLEQEKRLSAIIKLGLGITASFILLRALNVYGDPSHWSPQGSWTFTILSFINCEKYPPSLLYLTMTLGPGLLILALIEKYKPSGLPLLTHFGRVPMFFYLIHLPLIMALYTIFEGSPMANDLPESLLRVYIVWVLILVLLYPVCRLYDRFRVGSKWGWLRYF